MILGYPKIGGSYLICKKRITSACLNLVTGDVKDGMVVYRLVWLPFGV